MDTKDLRDKAEKAAWELTKKPSIYMKLIRLINFVAVILGKVTSVFKSK